jgi:hypothetical protein
LLHHYQMHSCPLLHHPHFNVVGVCHGDMTISLQLKTMSQERWTWAAEVDQVNALDGVVVRVEGGEVRLYTRTHLASASRIWRLTCPKAC